MLISSYFLIDKPFNFRRILKLWVQAVFYGVIIFLIAHIASPNEYPLKSLLPFFVPVLRSPWWFFTCYIGLVCLAPFLSKTANSLSESQYRTFFVILLLFGCTLTVGIPYGDIMGGNKGFSLIWFIVLFFIGGFFRKFANAISISKSRRLFLVFVLLAWAFIVAKAIYRYYCLGQAFILEIPAYNGIGALLSFPLFLWFRDKTFKTRHSFSSCLALFAPLSFGIYLIHDHPIIRNYLWHTAFDWSLLTNSPWMLPVMIAIVLIIYLLCAGLEFCRIWIFKLTRLDYLIDRTSDSIYSRLKSESTFLDSPE